MEWTSLVFFTVAAEAAVGIVLVYWLFGFTTAARERADSYAGLGTPVYLIAWLLTGIATIASLTHLGWPLSAFRAFGHLSSSWLSREVLLVTLFGLAGLAAWWRSRTAALPAWAVAVLGLLGLAETFASGMIYRLPSIPADANWFPVAFFLATVLLTGATGLLVLLQVTREGQALAAEWTDKLSLFSLLTLLLSGLLTFTYTSAAAHGLPEARAQAAAFTAGAWYPIRLVVGLLAPAGMVVWFARRPRVAQLLPVLALVAAVIVGELAGRLLFFTSTVSMAVNSGL